MRSNNSRLVCQSVGEGSVLVWFGLIWFGLVWFGLVWFGFSKCLKKLDRLASVVVHRYGQGFTGSNTRGKSFKINTALGPGVRLIEH